MTDTTVHHYSNGFAGVTQLTGQAGKLISVLDDCLVNGFGTVTLNSLVVSSNVATGTVSAGHGFLMIGGVSGTVIQIAGATPSSLNGVWRLASVPGTTTFTFATSGISDQTATGTITAKVAPAGFEKTYSGTNKAAYRSLAVGATGFYLRVEDTSEYASVRMYETMTDVDTGTNSSTLRYVQKSNTNDSTTRAFRIFCDDRAFYLLIDRASSAYYSAGMFFGDIISSLATDGFECGLIAGISTGDPHFYMFSLGSSGGELIRRADKTVGATALYRYSHQLTTTYVSTPASPFNVSYPSPTIGGLNAWPIEAWESSASGAGIRGLMPGVYNPLHTGSSLTDGAVISNVVGVNNANVRISINYDPAYKLAFCLDQPWR